MSEKNKSLSYIIIEKQSRLVYNVTKDNSSNPRKEGADNEHLNHNDNPI